MKPRKKSKEEAAKFKVGDRVVYYRDVSNTGQNRELGTVLDIVDMEKTNNGWIYFFLEGKDMGEFEEDLRYCTPLEVVL